MKTFSAALILVAISACDGPGNVEPSPSPPTSDAPCQVWGDPHSDSTVADGSISEISGIAVSNKNPGIIWVHEDSGSGPVLTAIDRSGLTITTLTLDGATSADWEDMAIGICPPEAGAGDCLFIGDVGDNGNNRTDPTLLIVAEPDLEAPAATLNATPLHYPFTYPDGPADCEALAVLPNGMPLLLTKRFDNISVPHSFAELTPDVPVELIAHQEFSTGQSGLFSAVTAADLWQQGTRLLVRTYAELFEYELPNADPAAMDPSSALRIQTALEIQGEAVAYDPLLRGIWHIAEGSEPNMNFIPCIAP